MINIDNLIKEAIKAKDSNLKYLRNLKAKILEFKTSSQYSTRDKDYCDEDELNILKNMVKVLKKSENEYFQAGREDLVSDCTSERKFLETFLPSPPDPEKIKLALESNSEFLENGNLSKKNMGAAIKYLKTQFPNADGKTISEIVKSYIV